MNEFDEQDQLTPEKNSAAENPVFTEESFFAEDSPYTEDSVIAEEPDTAEVSHNTEQVQDTEQPDATKVFPVEKIRTMKTGQDAIQVMKLVGIWCYRLRSVLLSIPVVVAAISLALKNMVKLPNMVGINLLPSGEYQFQVVKSVAVLGPLAVTAVCLLMMFSSRKVLYPWLISVFSLALPWLIWFTNVFPA